VLLAATSARQAHPNGRTTATINPATSRVVATSDADALPTGIRA
jgi:hypothetical protein